MFCHKCGYKLENGEKQCSNCGAIVRKLEVCGGFWGLAGEKRNQTTDIVRDTVQQDKSDLKILEKLNLMENALKKAEKSRVLSAYISFVLMIIVIFVFVISSIIILGRIDNMNENNQKIAREFREELADLNQMEMENVEPTSLAETAGKELLTEEDATRTAITEEVVTKESVTEQTTGEEKGTITEKLSETQLERQPETTERVTSEPQTTEKETISGNGI